MKQLLIIIVILFIQASFSQTVIDMADEPVRGETKNGQYYIKDINGYFDAFVGTWRYEYDSNKEFRLIITKIEMYHINESWANYYTDGLLVRYETYVNNLLTYSSQSDGFPSGVTKEHGKVDLTFFDYGRLGAGFNAELTLNQEIQQGGNNGEIKLHFLLDKFEAENPYHDEHPNEPFFSVPNDIIMTRL
jgi:hypothetical protein